MSLESNLGMVDFDITVMRSDDWPAIRSIYSEGIATGNATLESETTDWAKWDQRHLQDCRLVARNSIRVLGWAALSPVSVRRVYSGVAEVSVYVTAEARGCGVGKRLLHSLIERRSVAGYARCKRDFFPENVPSIALHKSCGFREVGVRHKLGQRDGIWRDVLLLERRSSKVGI